MARPFRDDLHTTGITAPWEPVFAALLLGSWWGCQVGWAETPSLGDHGAAPTFLKADASPDGYARIHIGPEGRLKVLVMGDPQVEHKLKYRTVGGDNENTFELIRRLVTSQVPDLVVILGDLAQTAHSSNYDYWVRYAELFEELRQPWMPVFGNHDSEPYAVSDAWRSGIGQVPKPELAELMSRYPHCLMIPGDAGPDAGAGNYFVNVATRSGEILYTFCAMDVHNDPAEPDGYVESTRELLIDWYERHLRAISRLKFGEGSSRLVRSMIFQHVPVKEFLTAWNEAWNEGTPTRAYHYGHWLEGDYRDSDDRLFEKVLELGSTTAMFFGHEHDNDFSVDYQGVRLTFVQHTGLSHYYRIYGRNLDEDIFDFTHLFAHRWPDGRWRGDERGATELTLTPEGDSCDFTIRPVYAKDVLPNYRKLRMNYDDVIGYLRARGQKLKGIPEDYDGRWNDRL
jgi:hypothetical protein